MKLTVDNKTIDFFEFDYKSISKGKLGVSVSGGSDSAIMFYLMAKHLKDVTLQPWSCVELEEDPLRSRPHTIDAAEKVIQYVRDKFPDADIAPSHQFEIHRDAPGMLAQAKLVNVPGWDLYPMMDKGVVKILNMEKHNKHAFETGMYGLLCGGTTMNPPQEVLDEWRRNDPKVYWEPRRSKHNTNLYNNKGRVLSHYKPFVNVNKKFLAGLYRQEDIMDLHNMTESCTGFPADTNWFQEPCKKCFWCHERNWAFGTYDHGEVS